MSEKNDSLPEIIIDEEFRRLLPPLDEHDYCSLEENILVYGCMNPLVLWNNILIDGHNRYSIVTKHELPFNTISLDFNSRDEAMSWMIKTQIERRNLTPMQLTYFRGLHYNIEKRLHGGGDRFVQTSPRGQNVLLNNVTANRLSEQYRVTERTIRRDAQIADVLIAIGEESEDAKLSILSGETRISRKQLRELSSDPDINLKETAKEIASGTFEEREPSANQSNTNIKGTNSDHPLTTAIISESHDFVMSIRPLSPTKDKTTLKSTIRTHINNLEKHYEQI